MENKQAVFTGTYKCILSILADIEREIRIVFSKIQMSAWYVVDYVRRLNVPRNIKVIKSSSPYKSGPSNLVVVSVVRDVEDYIESFIEYYLSLGCVHIVILDNCSQDKTVDKLLKYEQVTILSTSLPFSTYKRAFKSYLLDTFAEDSWCLIADIDEYFDYPSSDQIKLNQFLNYLNKNKYTAVATHMLDMFSDKPIRYWPDPASENLQDKCRCYDLSHIVKHGYHDDLGKWNIIRMNRLSNSNLRIYKGGIRKAFFDINTWLTKHPLIYRDGGAKLSMINEHACVNAFIADINCIFLHYKFDSNFIDRALVATRRKNYWDDSIHYRKYLNKTRDSNDFCFNLDSSRRLDKTYQLIEDGFIEVTKKYTEYINSMKMNKRVIN